MSRLVVLLYGLVSYSVGVAGLITIIMVIPGFISWGFLLDESSFKLHPIFWNSLLVIAWGVIHTGMARAGFKAALTKLLPEPAERATYTLVAGLSSIALIGFWQTVPGYVWHTESPMAEYLLWGLFAFGWTFCFLATFAINHFDLFGLRQVYLHYKQLPRPPVAFIKKAMYQYIRHPIQTGVLIGVWATPSMSMTQVVLSIGFTLYIYIGLWFEERDLVKLHGDDYVRYRNEAGKLFPKIGK